MNLLGKYDLTLSKISNFKCVETIIIYGSYSQNKQTQISDLDVAIIFKKNTSELKKNKILSYCSEDFELVNFHTLPLSLQYKILVEGYIYYTNIDLKNITINTTNMWFDFRERLDRMYEKRGYLTNR